MCVFKLSVLVSTTVNISRSFGPSMMKCGKVSGGPKVGDSLAWSLRKNLGSLGQQTCE